MDVYLVGGAVRDALLGRASTEHDYVVVGATPDDLLARGYRAVGKDFPVFLHPANGDQYALARTERKTGAGYYGFATRFSPDVTLEEDLARRDLTINAMARADDGSIVDPYGGRRDLEARVLRHVSPAFVEDPLRVLRVARFAARFAPLGFTVAPETLELMREIVRSGEMQALVAERVWVETERALGEARPPVYVEVLRACGALAAVFPEIDRLFGVPQPEKYHPEVDTGVHTLQVLDVACELSDDTAVRFAALVHDLGKGVTPRHEWPRHIGHEHAGVKVIARLCERLKVPNEHRELGMLASQGTPARASCARTARCHGARAARSDRRFSPPRPLRKAVARLRGRRARSRSRVAPASVRSGPPAARVATGGRGGQTRSCR